MKKLFVLFLLVALVPFSVGCSLWGGDDDAVTYPPVAKLVITPAAGIPNLLAAVPAEGDTYYGWYAMLNGVKLPITDVSDTVPPVLTFSVMLTNPTDAANYNAAQTAGAAVPVEIFNPEVSTTVPQVKFAYVSSGAGDVKVAYTKTTIAVTLGTTPATAVYTGTSEVATIVSVKNNNNTLNDTTAVVASITPAIVDGLKGSDVEHIDFVVTSNVSFDATVDPTYSVTVNDVAVAPGDFNIDQEAAGTTAIVRIPTANRVADKTYTVKISWIKADGMLVGSYTFKFKMPAA